jgi:hypothetical protein
MAIKKGPLILGGAVLGLVALGGIAYAAGKKSGGGGGGGGGGDGGCSNWRNATNGDVAADGTEPTFAALLSKPVGTTVYETHNGHAWKFVVCQGSNCVPPSSFQKDVRGFVCAG